MKSPFVGLRPFDRADADIFFGRNRDVEVLVNLVLTLPVVVVYATSGTGKSSLLKAGLVPVLEQREAVPVYVNDPAEDVWATVRRELGSPADSRANFHALFTEYADRTDRRPVVILDQFEERLKDQAGLDDLFGAIAALANLRSDAGTVVIALRDDYLAGLEGLLRRVPGLLDGSYRVPNLSKEDLVEAVYGPIKVVGGDTRISRETITAVLADLRREARPAGDTERVEAGYFQIVWSYLWAEAEKAGRSEITHDDYEAAGKAAGIIRAFVDSTLGTLLPFEAEALHAALRYLVLPTGAKVGLTIDDLAELLREDDLTVLGKYVGVASLVSLLPDLFDKLTRSGAPLFRRVRRRDRVEFELVHDLLGPILLGWRIPYAERVAALASGMPATRPPTSKEDRGLHHAAMAVEAKLRALVVALDRVTASELRSEWAELEPALERVATAWEVPRDSELRFLLDEFREAGLRRLRSAGQEFADVLQKAYQRSVALTLAMERTRSTTYSSRRPVWLTASLVVAVPLLGFGGVFGSWFLLQRLVDLPAIQYFPLSGTVAGGLLALCYLVGYDESVENMDDGRVLLWTAFPAAHADRHRIRGLAGSWPLPALVTLLGAVGGAYLFEAFGWAATAGFNFVGLFALIAGVVLYFFSLDW